MDASGWIAIAGIVVTQAVGLLVAWNAGKEKVNDIARSVIELEKTLNDKRAVLAETFSARMSETNTAVWRAINDNTNVVKDLVNKVDRDLSTSRGETLQQIERTSGRISTLETVFRMGQARREAYDAAEYLHKPEAAAAVVDALLDDLKRDLNKEIPMTPERKQELIDRLEAHIASKLPDTGERRLLKATKDLEGDRTPMPAEPHDKAPDKPKEVHEEEQKAGEAATKKLLGEQIVTEGPAIITVVPTDKEPPST